jgi:hypothetical protein
MPLANQSGLVWLLATEGDVFRQEPWAFRPTQGDEKRLLSGNRSPWKGRPERSAVDGPAVKAYFSVGPK